MPSYRIEIEQVRRVWVANVEMPQRGRLGVRRQRFNADTFEQMLEQIWNAYEESVPLRTDGPTFEEWVKGGYEPSAYPPKGFTDRRGETQTAAPAPAPAEDSKDTETAPAEGVPAEAEAASEESQGPASAEAAPAA